MRRINFDIDNAVKLHRSGKTLVAVASIIGVSVNAVRHTFRSSGIPVIDWRKDIPVESSAVLRLYESGKSLQQIAESIGVSRIVIDRRLREAGGVTRSHSQQRSVVWARLGELDRARVTKAAHDACRGRGKTDEELSKSALTREKKGLPGSRSEKALADLLRGRGVQCVEQRAFGRYNVDIAVDGSRVAVEVFGGHFHFFGSHAAGFGKRDEYIRGLGWTVIYVVATKRFPVGPNGADKIVSILEELRRSEPAVGHQYVIWGDGKPTSIRKRDFDKLSVVR